jgi:Ger(x)C family germination protein
VRKWALLLFLLALISSGCWDRIEVEERAYVLGVAIDLPKQEKAKRKITFAMPLVREVGASNTGGGGSGGENKVPLTTFDATASTIEEALLPIQNRMNRRLFFGHQKVLIISEESARLPIPPWLDFFERFSTIPRSILVAVSQGRASEALGTAPASEQLPPLYLDQLLMDSAQFGFGPHRNLNKLACYFESRASGFLLPLLKKNKDNIQIDGSAVLKQNKLVGTLDKHETRGALWLTGEVGGGTIVLARGQGLNKLSFEINDARCKMEPQYNRNGITFRAKVTVEGSIEEYFGSRNVMNPRILEQTEKEIARVIQGEIERAIARLQKELGTDALGLDMMVRKRNPKLWQTIENWNDYFVRNVKIELAELTVFIRRTGVLR